MLDGETTGTVGLVRYALQREKFCGEDIARWFENELAPVLTPFPGPRSVVIADNMPEHRSHEYEGRLRAAVEGRGAVRFDSLLSATLAAPCR